MHIAFTKMFGKKRPEPEKEVALKEKLAVFKRDISEYNADYNYSRFMHLVRSTFEELLGISYQFTYEEILSYIDSLPRVLQTINDDLKKSRDNLKVVYKEAKGSDDYKAQVKNAKSAINDLEARRKFYLELEEKLSDTDASSLIQSFSKEISDISYSGRRLSNTQIKSLFDKFSAIIEILTAKKKSFEDPPGLVSMIFSPVRQMFSSLKPNKADRPGPGPVEVPKPAATKPDILALIKQTKEAIKNNDLESAKSNYALLEEAYNSF